MQETQQTRIQTLSQRNPLGEENGNPLQFSCLENPMDIGVWRAAVSPLGCIESDAIEHAKVITVFFVDLLFFRHEVLSNSLWHHGQQHARLSHPSLSPETCSNSCPLCWWCHPAISSSASFFSPLQSFPSSRSFPMSQLFTSGGQSIGASASASVLPINIQDWFPLELTGLISLPSKGLTRI